MGMAAEDDKKDDLYAVLGLNKECTAAELRTAYKKLAMVSIFFVHINSSLFKRIKFPLSLHSVFTES